MTLTNYDDSFADVKIIFDKDNLVNTLGEIVSKAGKKQIRIAETEKYPHVTFFFSGGREEKQKLWNKWQFKCIRRLWQISQVLLRPKFE